MLPLTVEEVYCNGRRKVNPRTGEVIEDAVSNRAIFRRLAAEAREDSPPPERAEAREDGQAKGRAAARARKRLFELAVCNRFDLFVTLTISPDELDRMDYKAVVRRLNQWLSNLVKRHGFAYILVPELHKDGALHFHGLVTEKGLKLADSGKRDKRKKVIYNITNWRYGFTTAVRLTGDYGNICKYITKYISKGTGAGTIGGRYYFHGGNLQEAWCVYYTACFEETEGREIEIEGSGGLKIRYVS